MKKLCIDFFFVVACLLECGRTDIVAGQACRRGLWTQSKGLTVEPPLEQVDLVPLTSEGTALLSSSSGLESAHEAEAIRGSFFTHHLVGGLLGAADRDGDGAVTLEEAFEY